MVKVSAKVFDLKGKATGKVRLSQVFRTPLRPDVIKRAVIAIQSHRFQPQGRDPMAGKRTTAESRGVGMGISRVSRLKERQTAAFIPSAVGGRDPHPPLVEKKIRAVSFTVGDSSHSVKTSCGFPWTCNRRGPRLSLNCNR